MKSSLFMLCALTVVPGASLAGPEKIKFPSDYLRGTLYQTVDRADVKQ